jgi:hypothetical protein
MKSKSQRAFAAVTLLTVASVALVLIVYAALLGTIPGGEVYIGGSGSVNGTVYYSTDNTNGPWTTTLNLSGTGPGTSWYARLNTNTGYSGPVTISWQLQIKTGTSTWANVGSAQTTSISLDGTAQTIYTSGISNSGNHDWKAEVNSQAATYRVYVTVNTNP